MMIGVGCWRGRGATTTALLIAASLGARGVPPLLIEADPAGGVLAARLRLAPHSRGGLEHLAFASATTPFDERLAAVETVIGDVAVVAAPTDPFRAHACHGPSRAWVRELAALERAVVVDLGTIRAGVPLAQVFAELDHLVLVMGVDPASVMATVGWVEAEGRAAPGEPGIVASTARYVVVDAPVAGEHFSATVLRHELGPRCLGRLRWSPGEVDLVERGATLTDRRLRHGTLVRDVDAIVDQLLGGVG